MQFRHFRTRAAIFGKAPIVRRSAQKTSMASLRVIAALERTIGINEDVADVLHAGGDIGGWICCDEAG
jgi:hypothetical protein